MTQIEAGTALRQHPNAVQDACGALFSTQICIQLFISNPFLQSMTQIEAGTVLRQLPMRITTVINNCMHDGRLECSPVIFTIALYGTRMAHIFVRVCVLVHNGVLTSIFARHRGHQYLLRTALIFSHLRLDAATTK